MDIVLRVFTMLLSTLIFVNVIRLLVKRRLNESNSILWIFIAVVTLVLGFYPPLLIWLSGLLGVDYPPALLFLVAIILLMFITFKNSIELSKAAAKINEMAILISILKEENNESRAEVVESEERGNRVL